MTKERRDKLRYFFDDTSPEMEMLNDLDAKDVEIARLTTELLTERAGAAAMRKALTEVRGLAILSHSHQAHVMACEIARAAIQSDAGAKLLEAHKVELEKRDATIAAYREALEPFALLCAASEYLAGEPFTTVKISRGAMELIISAIQSTDPGADLLKRHVEELAEARSFADCWAKAETALNDMTMERDAANKRAEEATTEYEAIIDSYREAQRVLIGTRDTAFKRAEEAEAALAEAKRDTARLDWVFGLEDSSASSQQIQEILMQSDSVEGAREMIDDAMSEAQEKPLAAPVAKGPGQEGAL